MAHGGEDWIDIYLLQPWNVKWTLLGEPLLGKDALTTLLSRLLITVDVDVYVKVYDRVRDWVWLILLAQVAQVSLTEGG